MNGCSDAGAFNGDHDTVNSPKDTVRKTVCVHVLNIGLKEA